MKIVDDFLQLPRLWQAGLVILAAVYLAFAGMLSAAGGAYQPVPVVDSDFNKTVRLWYQVFVPHHLASITPDTWTCNPSLININESSCSEGKVLTIVISTNSSAFYSYQMNGFFDASTSNEIDGLTYSNNPLRFCSPQSIILTFPDNLVDSLDATVFYFVSL